MRGDLIPDPYGGKRKVRLLANTNAGICFRHPLKGVCGMRYDSMTNECRARLKLVKCKSQTLGKLMLFDVNRMTREERRDLATWLRRQANDVFKQGERYAPKFRSRFSQFVKA